MIGRASCLSIFPERDERKSPHSLFELPPTLATENAIHHRNVPPKRVYVRTNETESIATHSSSPWSVAKHRGEISCLFLGFVAGVVATLCATQIHAALTASVSSKGSGSSGSANDSLCVKTGGASHQQVERDYDETLDCFWPRTGALASMLMIQSLSSMILMNFHHLLDEHPQIVYFLTMLVGLGGNASGQSVVLSVRALALGKKVSVADHFSTGCMMALFLAPIAYMRARVSEKVYSPGLCYTVGVSVLFITAIGCTLGSATPLLFKMLHIDPGHTSPVVQVMMDMVGITCVCIIGAELMST